MEHSRDLNWKCHQQQKATRDKILDEILDFQISYRVDLSVIEQSLAGLSESSASSGRIHGAAHLAK